MKIIITKKNLKVFFLQKLKKIFLKKNRVVFFFEFKEGIKTKSLSLMRKKLNENNFKLLLVKKSLIKKFYLELKLTVNLIEELLKLKKNFFLIYYSLEFSLKRKESFFLLLKILFQNKIFSLQSFIVTFFLFLEEENFILKKEIIVLMKVKNLINFYFHCWKKINFNFSFFLFNLKSIFLLFFLKLQFFLKNKRN